MADNYLTWDAVEKRLRQFWQDSYPRDKIATMTQPSSELESGTERVNNSLVEYQHVYYYADVTVTKPDGSKWLYNMRMAFYQLPGQTLWNFNYASPLSSKQLGKATGEDPLKLTPQKALEVVKKYTDLMMQKHFPPAKWKDYCSANGVEIKILSITFKDPLDQVEREMGFVNDKIKLDPDESFRGSIVVEGEYKDKVGKFKFRLENIFPNMYVNVDGGFWTLAYNRNPVETLTPNDLAELKEKLLETADEPRKALEKYVPEPSPKDKAMDMMKGSDEGKRFDGIEELKWIQGVENDREVTDMLILLLDDPGQSVRDNAKSCLERHKDKTSDGGLKQKITEALDPAKASGKSFAKLKDSNPEVRKKTCEELYSMPKEIGSDEKLANLLMEITLNDQNEEVAAAARKALENAKYKADDGPIKENITAFFSNLKFFKYISDLESPDASARKTAVQNLGRNEAVAENEKALNGLIKLLSSDPEGSIKMEARIALDYQFSYCKDKLNPQIAEKIAHALGKTKPASSVATQSVQPATQVDEYTASVDSLKDPKKARDAVKKLKTKYEKEAAADDSAMGAVVDIWLKKDVYDSSTRMDARQFLDWQKSYNKDKIKPEVLQKIDDAFKAVKY